VTQVAVNFRVDEDLKKQTEQACKDMGLTLTSALTIFMTKVARERRIPFDVSAGQAGGFDQSAQGQTTILGAPSLAAGAPAQQHPANPAYAPSKTMVVLALQHVCAKFDAVDRAVLFGSYARGDQRPGSDCDVRLVIDKQKKFNLHDVSDFTNRVQQILGIGCDVITAAKIKDVQLAASIEQEGETIYERQAQ
jgi:addiction module RelB/DinJ family antitoxin